MSFDLCQEELLQRWHTQVGQRRPYRRCRPLAALSYLCRGPLHESGLIDLRHLLLVVLFDDPIGLRAPALRFVGYGASQVEHGVEWSECKFYKDVRIEPENGASGLQLDSSQTELLQLALRMRSERFRYDRYFPKASRPEPKLPRVWAGFSPTAAESLVGDGPELHALCEEFDLPHEAMFRNFERAHQGLLCYPIEWVSGALRNSLELFAELDEMPRLQVFRVASLPEGLIGYQGAMAFDFYHSRQREQYTLRLERSREHRLAPQEARFDVAAT